MGLSYRGPKFQIGGRNPFPHAPNLRLVMRGSPLLVGLLVRKDSPIKTVHDVKGKRMTGEYPAHLAVWYNMFGHLASAGLTWNDVKVIPVPAVNEGVDPPALQGVAPRARRRSRSDDPLPPGRHPLLQGTRCLETGNGAGAATVTDAMTEPRPSMTGHPRSEPASPVPATTIKIDVF